MSELVVGSLKGLSANSYVIDVASGSTLDLSSGAVLPTGSVVQVVQTAKTDTFSTTSTSFTPITGLSASITPKFATSKILVKCAISYGASATNVRPRFRFKRDSTAIGIGNAEGSRLQTTGGFWVGHSTDAEAALSLGTMGSEFLDSPASTSAISYSVDIGVHTNTVHINRAATNTDSALMDFARGISTITLMEIAG